MKRVETLIDQVRKLTGNTRYDSNSGIGQDIMCLYLSNAQDEVMKSLVNSKSKYLQKEKTYSVVNSQQLYSFPSDIYFQNIDTMQWSQSGIDYVNMSRSMTKDRTYNRNGYAFGYYLRNDGFIVTPPLESGSIVLNYIRQLPRLATRSGKISAVSLTGQTLTALTVNTAEASYDSSQIASDNVLCVVDYLGNIKARAIVYTSQASGVFTLSSQVLADGETIAVGDYIVIGRLATNIPELPEIAEGFLIKYASYECKYGDSSQWSKETKLDVADTLTTLNQSFNLPTDDITDIPITNFEMLQL